MRNYYRQVEYRDATQPQGHQVRAIGGLQDFCSRISIESLIQPGFLEFIIRYHSVPELVAKFVDDDPFWILILPEPPRRSGSDKCRIFHPARATAIVRRVDNGQRIVRIFSVP